MGKELCFVGITGVQSMGTPELLNNAFKAEGDTVNSWLAEADYKTVMHMLVQHRMGSPGNGHSTESV